MKSRLFAALVLICAVMVVPALPGEEPQPSADDVVATMLAWDGIREAASGGYTGHRHYLLENQRFDKQAQMFVNVTCDQNGMKHFEVVSENGWKSANKRVLRQMLVTESDSSRPETRPKSRITSDNYTFRMIDKDALDGRAAYLIEVTPKRQDKNLFRGRIWVDVQDYALARVEGEPAQNPSFWTKRVHFVQRYQKSGNFWYPALTTSMTDARIFGATNVTIRYFDYLPFSDTPTLPPNPALMDAKYAKR